jgi:hypothetical protein
MQMLAPIFGTLFGGGAAAGTAAAAASTASTLGTLGSIVGVGATLSQISYQNKVAANAAMVARQNSERALQQGQEAQRDQDIDAQAQIAALTANQAASGFSVFSPSYQRVQARNRVLARRDAERIRTSAENTANNFLAEATSAENQKQGLFLPLLSGAIDIKSSMISGSSLVRNTRARQVNNSTRQIAI